MFTIRSPFYIAKLFGNPLNHARGKREGRGFSVRGRTAWNKGVFCSAWSSQRFGLTGQVAAMFRLLLCELVQTG